jgi:hypothetical protein
MMLRRRKFSLLHHSPDYKVHYSVHHIFARLQCLEPNGAEVNGRRWIIAHIKDAIPLLFFCIGHIKTAWLFSSPAVATRNNVHNPELSRLPA